jgi:hypothetical protein
MGFACCSAWLFPRKLRAMTRKTLRCCRGVLLLLPAAALVVHFLARTVAAADPDKARRLPCPAHVPEALDPPEQATIEMGLPASGVQVYACSSAKPGEAPSWTLEAPHALLSSGDRVTGIHFAGPTWQGLDGSQVKGARLASADAPAATAIPWLLLSATPAGTGTFSQTTHIQRLDTVGGKAPSSGCDASHVGAKVLVPYRANYFFYRSAAAGEPVRQCRSKAAKTKKS